MGGGRGAGTVEHVGGDLDVDGGLAVLGVGDERGGDGAGGDGDGSGRGDDGDDDEPGSAGDSGEYLTHVVKWDCDMKNGTHVVQQKLLTYNYSQCYLTVDVTAELHEICFVF